MADVKSLKIKGVNITDIIYPVGSIYETMDSSFNPSESFGGTWERIKGKVLVGVDESDSTFKSSKLIGGEKSHTLTINEMPSHEHKVRKRVGTTNDSYLASYKTNVSAGTIWTMPADVSWDNPDHYYAQAVGGTIPQQSSTLYYLLYLAKNILIDFISNFFRREEVCYNG